MGRLSRPLPKAALMAFAVVTLLADAAFAIEQSPYMRVFGTVQPPYGFVLFCQSFPQECRDGENEQRMSATPDRLAELDAINRAINKAIEPATDMEIYGVSEHWTIPKVRGDCEDYALLKRRTLIERGWPVGSLLMTVVRDEKGEGHAILTARTTQGDFILDNKNDDIKVWHKTPYEFVMRQSYLNARVWMSLDPRQGSMLTASAPEKSRAQAAISNLGH